MSDKKITPLLIDTSYLRTIGSGLDHADFMKLVHRSAIEGTLKMFIPHIVWEERRTQLLDQAYSCMRTLRESFDALNKQWTTNIVLKGLGSPALNYWNESEVDMWSRKAMKSFAAANKIEIISLGPDHANRAWDRYFDVQPPFNRDEKRENRRKDIPDSWIFEAAIDTAKKHPGLLALVRDQKLSSALRSIGIQVFNEPQEVFDEIDRSLTDGVEVKPIATQDTVPVTIQEQSQPAVPENALQLALGILQQQFKDLDTRILGYVGYLGSPSKDQLFALLSKSGISVETTRNVLERLVISGLLMDTGNHYISRNKTVSDLAANLVELEIIKLLEEP